MVKTGWILRVTCYAGRCTGCVWAQDKFGVVNVEHRPLTDDLVYSTHKGAAIAASYFTRYYKMIFDRNHRENIKLADELCAYIYEPMEVTYCD